MIMSIEKLIELAEKIKDVKLKEKTIELLKDIKLTHPEFQKYERENPEDVKTPFAINDVIVIRDLINHTISVVEVCMKIVDVIRKKLWF